MTSVNLVWITPNTEEIIAYCARVSSPKSDEEKKENAEGLLKYCIANRHWSIFEMANMCVEINTTRAISRQILRHRSFHFQEFSQRYAVVAPTPIWQEARAPHPHNRQKSIELYDPAALVAFDQLQQQAWKSCAAAYEVALADGVAKECARSVLPEGLTPSRLYMNGTIRDWLHYIDVRQGNGTQKEHVHVAWCVKEILAGHCNNITGAMWPKEKSNEEETSPTIGQRVGTIIDRFLPSRS